MVQNGFHPGRFATHGAHTGSVFHLASGLLEPQVERFFFQSDKCSPQLVRAIDTARALFASLPTIAPDREQAAIFLAGLGRMSASAVSQLPRDLFYPAAGADTDTRAVTLPDGSEGSIAVQTDAETNGVSGLLTSCERRITTRLPDGVRLAAERWSLRRIR